MECIHKFLVHVMIVALMVVSLSVENCVHRLFTDLGDYTNALCSLTSFIADNIATDTENDVR